MNSRKHLTRKQPKGKDAYGIRAILPPPERGGLPRIPIMMPTMGKPETASSFGKMVLGDARTAFSWLQKLPDDQKPEMPILYMMDELGSYSTPALARPFEQNRSAKVILVPMVQTVANLEAVSTEFSQMVIGNTWTKVFLAICILRLDDGDFGVQSV